MYGFTDYATAQRLTDELQKRDTVNRYKVGVHHWPESNIWGRGNCDKTSTYGVMRYVPYVPQMPWKFDGFVWF